MGNSSCSILRCTGELYGLGYCRLHYAKLVDRFNAKVDRTGSVSIFRPSLGNCWNWTGHVKQSNGYAYIKVADRSSTTAHTVSYELAYGAIPEGLVIDHLCRNTMCVNPVHLEAVTQRENVLRGAIGQRYFSTTCGRGHDRAVHMYTSPVTGKRQCRECLRLMRRKNAERLAMAA